MAPAIPIADAARALAQVLGEDPLLLALHGGEDYELLFTAPASALGRLSRLDVVLIGRITHLRQGLGMEDARGRPHALPPSGFDHFRSR